MRNQAECPVLAAVHRLAALEACEQALAGAAIEVRTAQDAVWGLEHEALLRTAPTTCAGAAALVEKAAAMTDNDETVGDLRDQLQALHAAFALPSPPHGIQKMAVDAWRRAERVCVNAPPVAIALESVCRGFAVPGTELASLIKRRRALAGR